MPRNKNLDRKYVIDREKLPNHFPTHRHEPVFWEALGRTVATFGFLEEVLGKAIFAFQATKRYPQDEVDAAYDDWRPRLERALTDPLGGLIGSYEQAVKAHPDATLANLTELVNDLRTASEIRNVLCHGSWRSPNPSGGSIPLFVDRRKRIFESQIDAKYLQQVQAHAAELACSVINSVTHMGLQFPGSRGPGMPIQ